MTNTGRWISSEIRGSDVPHKKSGAKRLSSFHTHRVTLLSAHVGQLLAMCANWGHWKSKWVQKQCFYRCAALLGLSCFQIITSLNSKTIH